MPCVSSSSAGSVLLHMPDFSLKMTIRSFTASSTFMLIVSMSLAQLSQWCFRAMHTKREYQISHSLYTKSYLSTSIIQSPYSMNLVSVFVSQFCETGDLGFGDELIQGPWGLYWQVTQHGFTNFFEQSINPSSLYVHHLHMFIII